MASKIGECGLVTSAARGLYHKHVQVVYTITGLERWNGDIDLVYGYNSDMAQSHLVLPTRVLSLNCECFPCPSSS